MADKKITIKPGDMERLRELMRQEEEKLDAANPSDEELTEWENRLEDAVRDLARKTPGTLPSVTEERDRNWAELQQKMKQAPQPAPEVQKPADVLPLTRPSKNKMLPWLGVAAAAALVVIMVRPRRPDDSLTMNDSRVQVKGTSGPAFTADCEVDVASLDGSPVVPAADGQGFIGKAGSEVEISARCNSSGFLRAELQGPDSQTFVTPVTNGERQRFLRDGQIARISLQSGKPWSISLVLTNGEFTKDQAVPQDQILWQDKITVGARE